MDQMHSTAPARTKLSLMTVGAAVLAGLTAGSATPARAERFDGLQLVYQATFANGSLQSGIDPLKIGPLKLGASGEPGINPSWVPSKGDYAIGVTRPVGLTGPAVISGIYATPVDFDTGSIVGLRATFVAPVGPHNSTDVWAITVVVRPGGVDPLIADPLASVTFQVRGIGARLNTPGAATPAAFPNVPQEIYDAIFDEDDPQPFTLEMLVNRREGYGEASLKVGDAVFSRTYEFAVFRANSGPAITNVGANIAVANAAGGTASVRLRSFEIYASKRSTTPPGDPLCPPEFGCQLAPQISQTDGLGQLRD